MELDYNLEIIKQRKSFKPLYEFIEPIINSNSKIFEISGDNGYGKTFLLNLIAYAMHAEKLDDNYVFKSIKDSLKRYNQKEDYKLDYTIKFDLKNNGKLILKKEINGDRLIFLNSDSPSNYNELHKNLTILYDVPTDPNERLNGVIKDLQDWNEKLKTKTHNYFLCLQNLSNGFDNIKDENKIIELEGNIKELEGKIEDAKISLSSNEEKLNKLIGINHLNKLNKVQREIVKLNSTLIKEKEKLKKIDKPKKSLKKNENKILELSKKYKVNQSEFENLIKSFITIISSNIELNDYIESKSIINKTYEFVRTLSFENFIKAQDSFVISSDFTELINQITAFILNEEKGKKYIINNFLKDLLHQIDELIKMEVDDVLEQITKNKTLDIKNEINKKLLSNIVNDYKIIKADLTKIANTPIFKFAIEASKIEKEINKEKEKNNFDSNDSEYYILESSIDSIQTNLKSKERDTTILKVEVSKYLGINIEYIENYETSSERLAAFRTSNINIDKLEDEISEEQKAKNFLVENLSDFNDKLIGNKARLQLEEKKESNKFSASQQKRINNLKMQFGIAYRNLKDFSNFILEINKGEFSNVESESNMAFFKIAGMIITYSMGNKILSQNGEYINLKYYDIVKGDFHCEDDIIINKYTISTGLASGNYLKQRIANLHGDYVVILLDEIGNMSKKTLNEVIKSIKAIESEGRLLIALFTRPNSDQLEINSY